MEIGKAEIAIPLYSCIYHTIGRFGFLGRSPAMRVGPSVSRAETGSPRCMRSSRSWGSLRFIDGYDSTIEPHARVISSIVSRMFMFKILYTTMKNDVLGAPSQGGHREIFHALVEDSRSSDRQLFCAAQKIPPPRAGGGTVKNGLERPRRAPWPARRLPGRPPDPARCPAGA